MTRSLPALWLFLAAAPGAKGASAVLAEARAAADKGHPIRAILSGPGLEWASEETLAALARFEAVEISLCSQSVRQSGRSPDALPSWIRWSSVAAWLGARKPEEGLWGVFP